MSLQNEQRRMSTKRLVLLSVFLGYALIMGIVERWIPFSIAVPGVKLGLANVVILTALYLFTLPETLMLAVLKCTMTAIFAGSFTSFLYGFCGTMLSVAVMAVMIRGFGNKISPVGVSVMGAVAHNVGQILMASLIMQTWLIASHLSLLLVSGAITGVLVGMIVRHTMKLVQWFYDKEMQET